MRGPVRRELSAKPVFFESTFTNLIEVRFVNLAVIPPKGTVDQVVTEREGVD
jgi:hypothetical protein